MDHQKYERIRRATGQCGQIRVNLKSITFFYDLPALDHTVGLWHLPQTSPQPILSAVNEPFYSLEKFILEKYILEKYILNVYSSALVGTTASAAFSGLASATDSDGTDATGAVSVTGTASTVFSAGAAMARAAVAFSSDSTVGCDC